MGRKVGLSDQRVQLMAVVWTRLGYLARSGEDVDMDQMAALITDDILGSGWNTEAIAEATTRGIDAGFEKGLRQAIVAVGEMERVAGWEGGPVNLIEYDEAQRHIARLSQQGLEALWAKEIGEGNDGQH